MSAKICSHPDGSKVTRDEEKDLRIYAMSDAEVAGFDCGSRGHPDFPRQKPMAVSKPLLSDMLQAVAAHELASGHQGVLFNIEIKSTPEGDNINHPPVEVYADILYRTLKRYGVLERTSIQSFDPRALEAIHRMDPQVSTVLLVENQGSFKQNLNRLSFVPTIYSPDFKLLNEQLISAAQALNIRVIPWTVDSQQQMQRLIDMGVDGLITDYPDVGKGLLQAQ